VVLASPDVYRGIRYPTDDTSESSDVVLTVAFDFGHCALIGDNDNRLNPDRAKKCVLFGQAAA
jgi:hypothetical protein